LGKEGAVSPLNRSHFGQTANLGGTLDDRILVNLHGEPGHDPLFRPDSDDGPFELNNAFLGALDDDPGSQQ
jgi:hypothetical protein